MEENDSNVMWEKTPGGSRKAVGDKEQESKILFTNTFKQNRLAMRSSYPNCTVFFPSQIGDGKCDGGAYNTEECGWDGGDCIEFNEKYPDCTVDSPHEIGNGSCFLFSGPYNTEECGWDGGDCNAKNEVLWEKYPNCRNGVYPGYIGSGHQCNDGIGAEECGWDGGDCIEFNSKYPNCTVDYPYIIGDGKCDREGDTEECGFDGGDCIKFNTTYPNCTVSHPGLIGNEYCNSGSYNTKECGWDGGDCIEFNEKYPNCKVDIPFLIGDSICHHDDSWAGRGYNTIECGFDGGDCVERNFKENYPELYKKYPDCRVDDYSMLGDGKCYRKYSTKACGWDGGDCPSSPMIYGIIFGTMAVVVIIGYLVFRKLYLVPRRRRRSIEEDGMQQNPQRIDDSEEQQRSMMVLPSAPVMDEMSRRMMDRHTLVLTSIIHKKVISSTKSNNIDDYEVNILPHEAILSERSIYHTTRMYLLQEDEEENKNNESHDKSADLEAQQSILQQKKHDIMVETLRSIRATNNFNLKLAESSDDDLYNPKVCPICCEEYVKGDDIAWSKNEECAHAFHTDCIVPWLMEHNDCPMCRNDYLCDKLNC